MATALFASNMQQQQQQQQQQHQEEYVQAQRSAAEALQIGRATLTQAAQQGEQLENASQMADETQYKLDKAGRMLRGMTWSGWVANAFTRNTVGPPPTTSSSSRAAQPPAVYEQVPESCRPLAQAIQNYHANVKVLEECETADQRETCRVICNAMYETAAKQWQELDKNLVGDAYALQFESDLAQLRERQQKVIPAPKKRQSPAKKVDLLPSGPDAAAQTTTAVHPHMQHQEEHLQVMADHLDELGSIATSLSHAVVHQTETIDNLDGKADHIVEKTKMVTRRADRIIQKKSWTPVKPIFSHHVTIRHSKSGRYLSIIEGKLQLTLRFMQEASVFGLWKRQGQIFGLQNKDTRRWIGQNLLGNLACSASQFGRREEWEADDDLSQTRLLCASAGWGAGGYLLVRDTAVAIGGCGVEERKKADVWCLDAYTA